jgi:hypothetical protein
MVREREGKMRHDQLGGIDPVSALAYLYVIALRYMTEWRQGSFHLTANHLTSYPTS